MRVVQIVHSLSQILDLLHTSHFCMGFTNREIMIEISISFSSFIRSVNVLLQPKCSQISLLSG